MLFYFFDFFFCPFQKLQTTEKQLKERIKTIADLEHELEKMRDHLSEGRQVSCHSNLDLNIPDVLPETEQVRPHCKRSYYYQILEFSKQVSNLWPSGYCLFYRKLRLHEFKSRLFPKTLIFPPVIWSVASYSGVFREARISSVPTNACSIENNIPFPSVANHIVLSKFWKVHFDGRVTRH